MQACAWEYDPLLVKVWIIADGLKVVASQGFDSIKVESNHLTVVKSFVKMIIKLNASGMVENHVANSLIS